MLLLLFLKEWLRIRETAKALMEPPLDWQLCLCPLQAALTNTCGSTAFGEQKGWAQLCFVSLFLLNPPSLCWPMEFFILAVEKGNKAINF